MTDEILKAVFVAGALSFVGAGVVYWLRMKARGKDAREFFFARAGGVAVVGAIAITVLVHPTLVVTHAIASLVGGLTLLLVVGLLDDRWKLSWKILLGSHILAALMLLFGGVRLWYVNGFFGEAVRLDTVRFQIPDLFCSFEPCLLPALGSIVLVAWIVAVINAMNWLDGSDGVASAVSALVLLVAGILALQPEVNQPPVAILAGAGLGAILGFFPFNFPRARFTLGSSGSFGIGFFIAAIAVLAGAKIATVAMVLLLPAADACAVFFARLFFRARVTRGDTRHLHHALSRRGWSKASILALHVSVSAVAGILALLIERPLKLLVLTAFFFVTAVFLFRMKVKEGRAGNKT